MGLRPMGLSCRSFLSGDLALLGSTVVRTAPSRAAAASDLDFAPAVAAARAIRTGEVSSVELTTRVLERIKRYNPQIAISPVSSRRRRGIELAGN